MGNRITGYTGYTYNRINLVYPVIRVIRVMHITGYTRITGYTGRISGYMMYNRLYVYLDIRLITGYTYNAVIRSC